MADLSISSPPFRITGACHFRNFRDAESSDAYVSQTLVRRAIVSGGNLSIEPPGGIGWPPSPSRAPSPSCHANVTAQPLQMGACIWRQGCCLRREIGNASCPAAG